MKHKFFYASNDGKYKIALLIKESAFASKLMEQHYITPLISKGLTPDSIIALSLDYTAANKAPMSVINPCIDNILRACNQIGVDTLLVADAAYFKKLTKLTKADPHFGYIKPCGIKGYEHINVILSVNYQAIFHNPAVKEKLEMSLNTLIGHITNTHIDLGTDIIKFEEYPDTSIEIERWLDKLIDYKILTCDVETLSLNWWETDIETITFCWSQHEGIAFSVCKETNVTFQERIKNVLRTFFQKYDGTLIYHGGTFDIKIIIASIFMKTKQDIPGLIKGLEVMYRKVEDTKLLTYLATNSTAGNDLGLKQNAFEFTGNYAQDDIKDTSQISAPDLLRYNLVDGCATWYVFNKNYPIVVQDNQEQIYREIFLPSMKVITHMELVGMPMHMPTIQSVNVQLEKIRADNLDIVRSSQIIKDFTWELRRREMIKANAKLKRKVKSIDEFDVEFNPNSNPQLQILFHEFLDFPVIDKTDSGAPASGGATLQKHINRLIEEHGITEEDLK